MPGFLWRTSSYAWDWDLKHGGDRTLLMTNQLLLDTDVSILSVILQLCQQSLDTTPQIIQENIFLDPEPMALHLTLPLLPRLA